LNHPELGVTSPKPERQGKRFGMRAMRADPKSGPRFVGDEVLMVYMGDLLGNLKERAPG